MIKPAENHGFTLIELLMFMGIFSVLLIVLTEIITSALNVQLESKSVSTVEQDGRYILTRLDYDLHQARSIIQPAVLGTAGMTNQLIININGSQYSYNLTGNNLVQTIGINSYALNSFDSKVSLFNVTRYGSGNNLDSVKINFTLTSITKPKEGPKVKAFETTLGLRCYSSSCL